MNQSDDWTEIYLPYWTFWFFVWLGVVMIVLAVTQLVDIVFWCIRLF